MTDPLFIPLSSLFAQGHVVVRFQSHRAREYGCGRKNSRGYVAVWSYRRRYKGGTYVMPLTDAQDVCRRVSGAAIVRKPYEDFGHCW